MAIPAYMWLKDDGGSAIKGSVDVHGREDSVEIVEFQPQCSHSYRCQYRQTDRYPAFMNLSYCTKNTMRLLHTCTKP